VSSGSLRPRADLVTQPVHIETAAALYRACRRAGETIRKITDCLVAVPAIEAGATLIQADRDFEILARHTPLRLEPLAA